MDVDGSTLISVKKSPYEISLLMFRLYSEMSDFFLTKNYLTFFMGGDNFMIVTSGNGKEHALKFLDFMKEKHGIALNCGIGTAKTAREAAKLATKALDTLRELRDSGKNQQQILELAC
jgi:GTP cyclohydrolase IIa